MASPTTAPAPLTSATLSGMIFKCLLGSLVLGLVATLLPWSQVGSALARVAEFVGTLLVWPLEYHAPSTFLVLGVLMLGSICVLAKAIRLDRDLKRRGALGAREEQLLFQVGRAAFITLSTTVFLGALALPYYSVYVSTADYQQEIASRMDAVAQGLRTARLAADGDSLERQVDQVARQTGVHLHVDPYHTTRFVQWYGFTFNRPACQLAATTLPAYAHLTDINGQDPQTVADPTTLCVNSPLNDFTITIDTKAL